MVTIVTSLSLRSTIRSGDILQAQSTCYPEEVSQLVMCQGSESQGACNS